MFIKVSEKFRLCRWNNGVYALSGADRRPFFRLGEKQLQTLLYGEYDGKDALVDRLIKSGAVDVCDRRVGSEITEYDNPYFDRVVFSITGRCNYKCMHCSVNSGAASFEMSPEQIKNTIRGIKECGLDNITLIGGEPLMRKDFFGVVDELLDSGLTVASIYTNGSLVNEKVLGELESRGIKPSFQISFDGVGFHDKMRGVNGAEKNLFRVLELLRKKDYRVSCYMSLTSESVSSLKETIRSLASFGVSSFTAYPPFECGRWRNADTAVKPSFERLIEEYISVTQEYIASAVTMDLEFYRFVYIRGSDHKYKILPNAAVKPGSVDVPVCRIYGKELNISPQGYLSPCYAIMDSNFIKQNMPNINEVSLKTALSDPAFLRCSSVKAADVLNNDPECVRCDYRSKCGGGCRSSALTEEGSFWAHDPVMCRMFREGWYDKLKTAAQTGYSEYLKVKETAL